MIKLHEFGQIELRFLEDLSFVDEDVLEGEDFRAIVSDLLGDGLGKDLFEEVSEVVGLAFLQHDLHHLLTDGLDLGSFSVAGSFDLTVLASSEGNGEESDKVTISGLGLDETFNKGVPLLDEGAHLVSGNGETVEVGEAFESFNFLNLELDDSPGEILSVGGGQISVGDGENTTSERVSGDVLSLGLVARGKSGDSDLKERGGTHVVPLLLDERVKDLFLLLSLLFEVSGVLSGCHDSQVLFRCLVWW